MDARIGRGSQPQVTAIIHLPDPSVQEANPLAAFIQVSRQDGSGDVLYLGEILVPGVTPLAALEAKDGPALFLKS